MKSKTAILLAFSLLATANAHAQTAVSVVNGHLSLTTPNTPQNVKVEVGPTVGEARVYGFSGIPDGARYRDIVSVHLRTSNSIDKVEFDIQSSQNLAIRVDTRAGEAETKIKWKILPGVAAAVASVDLVSVTGVGQKAEIEIDSEVSNATVSVNTGNYMDTATRIVADDPSSFLAVRLNGRAPKAAWEIVSAAPVVDVDWLGSHSIGEGEIKFLLNQVVRADVSLLFDVGLSTGNDLLEAKIEAPGSTVILGGAIRGQAGSDRVLVEPTAFSTTSGLDLLGGTGNDELSLLVKGRFQLSQELGVLLAGGDGDDRLILTTDTGIFGTGLPNDLIPVINGGSGFDLHQGFGSILNTEGRL